ncbi:glycine dehydrogenase [Thermonema lapsum]|uniref:Glycine dehydrogenase (decarboxylating) n=1 Tax=Thermonema lapsum TaxID=28195 RepID=A0A846MMQ3_9BACT|nr:aminomethyl-transferring glycine dehydrogenase [Thermonema lapsum]NIK72749.1 glycine dehydrogenase [Thermonema lapsum]
MKQDWYRPVPFVERHIGSDAAEQKEMLRTIGVESIEELIAQTIPASIRLQQPMALPDAVDERHFLEEFKALAQKNKVYRSYIGMGYYGTVTPSVILRNILENPAWYTAYTPYQAEIAQGRLEALLNFQTMIADLTGMELANASLLDEATAAAEAMNMLYQTRPKEQEDCHRFFVSKYCFPQTIDVLLTRAEPLGIELVVGDENSINWEQESFFGVLVQYPNVEGEVIDYTALFEKAHARGTRCVVAADLLSLCLLKSPAAMGAEVAVGSTQRFGVPMGFGGPHAAYFATKEEYKRHIPGRIIGVSKDAEGKPALRMALQTREQHIRRERATSNICTSQVLLAVMASMYAVYHGPQGLRRIAERVHGMTALLADTLQKAGFSLRNKTYFDTLTIACNNPDAVRAAAEKRQINLYYGEDYVRLSIDETVRPQDLEDLLAVFAEAGAASLALSLPDTPPCTVPPALLRSVDYLQHPVFNTHHTEHEMLRYIRSLEEKDLSLVHSMISLGSCTMKLNATTEMLPVTWAEWANIHPFAPSAQTEGYRLMIERLSQWLCTITGFDAISMQPNSGAQGEYTGLMVIRAYLKSKGEGHRHVALIPASAHGTNPASAVMAGMKVVVVKTDERGNIDIEDLKAKAQQHANDLACLMITYPSTHGVFEESVQEICDIIHQYGGQVYMDGANMNAQVGLTNPAIIGADVCHLNLHKTFCIPHGGGGPGMGPIAVKKHLAPFLPNHVMSGEKHAQGIHAVAAAPFGSASILPISYAYIAMMGAEGLTEATKAAILHANYIKARLEKAYPILYTNEKGRVAHEMIIDCRAFKKVGIEVEDIAKRLMDYGFHAPTVSFPVPGTLMIEPTESESKAELDRFCDALLAIREEIAEIERGEYPKDNNVLTNAPHTAAMLTAAEWNYPYSREKAAYPLPYLYQRKFWVPVRRVDNAYGDRNLVCSCLPVSAYEAV